jgi:DNA-binding PadR family transcriptional regulator
MSNVGELETLILLAILRLGPQAYGVSVKNELARRTGRHLTRGAIYTALRRLEAKGLIDGTLGEVTPARGGRAKRYLSVSEAGLAAVRTASRDFDQMRAGLDGLIREGP